MSPWGGSGGTNEVRTVDDDGKPGETEEEMATIVETIATRADWEEEKWTAATTEAKLDDVRTQAEVTPVEREASALEI